MSSVLRSAFAKHVAEPDHRESVIVTIGPDCSVADVDGLEVTATARSGTILMGTATVRAVGSLAERPGVIRIEHDSGDMHAME
jgi:hypothetical protein